MRKNGINREITEIDGGICAPVGFRANGIHCGFTADENKKDLALVVAERRCPTACMYSTESKASGPAATTKRHLKYGLARAILVNSGVANVGMLGGERLAEMACRVLAASSDVDCNDTIIASTGVVGQPMELSTFEAGMRPLVRGLQATNEGSLAAAEAIMTTDSYPKHTAFSFELGDFPCKMGVLFKGNLHVCPNMATTLIFLTTDVNISSEMLQKALSICVRDTVNMLVCDGTPSPNDMVCIMANGKAGNYKISCDDTEFSKFVFFLKKVLFEICRRLTADCDKQGRVLCCKVTGAKSQQTAKAVAKALVSSSGIRRMLSKGENDIERIMYTINGAADLVDFTKMEIALEGTGGSLVFYEDSTFMPIEKLHLLKMVEWKEVTLKIALNEGNYSATALGCIEEKEILS